MKSVGAVADAHLGVIQEGANSGVTGDEECGLLLQTTVEASLDDQVQELLRLQPVELFQRPVW